MAPAPSSNGQRSGAHLVSLECPESEDEVGQYLFPALMSIAMCALAALGVLFCLVVSLPWIVLTLVSLSGLLCIWYDVAKERRTRALLRQFHVCSGASLRDAEDWCKTLPRAAHAGGVGAAPRASMSEADMLLLCARSKMYNSL
ncbi:hypothetical protein HPB49_008928 [Dermacentor silvarum]|uniref:Uncharacterized protein n=1 Tax=Dermacentor silvarum TaxID=543639 RepID=A0ACB8DYC1_DERSI|nr:hypothetical protein HPB49_008928 [Dermacentor silvarum]